MRLLITRHPTTEYNEKKIFQGKQHGSITELGYKQIKKLIQRLKKENITRIISSDALRCKLTTEEISKEINVPVEYTGFLDEIDYGEFTGKNVTEVDKTKLTGNSIEKIQYPNGESLMDIKQRGEKFFNQIIEKYKETQETILIVSHEIFLQILIGNLLGMNIKNSRHKLIIDCCSLSKIKINKKYRSGYKLLLLNEIDFLKDLN